MLHASVLCWLPALTSLYSSLIIDGLRKSVTTGSELGFSGLLWALWLCKYCRRCYTLSSSPDPPNFRQPAPPMALQSLVATPFVAGVPIVSSLHDSLRLFLTGKSIPAALARRCHIYVALQVFSWLNGLALFGYWLVLLVLVFLARSRGNKSAFMLPTTKLANAAGELETSPPQNYPPGSKFPGTGPLHGQSQDQVSHQDQMYPPPYASAPAPPPPYASSPSTPRSGNVQV
jgi:hypothetical protein